jgi:hypothetical protein
MAVLRQQPADAAVAANPAGLHRDMGGAGRGAFGYGGLHAAPLVARAATQIDLRYVATFSLLPFGISYRCAPASPDTDLWHYVCPISCRARRWARSSCR